jgi:hypothetical protein
MTLQVITSDTGLRIPNFPSLQLWSPAAANATIDLGDEAVHMCGNLFLPGRTGTKTLSAAGGGSIWWLPGTVTFANGSTNLRVGLQDLDASGQQMRGDGTFDVYADLVGGTDTITTATFLETVMETGTKTLSHGDKFSISFTMTTRGGADSVLIRGQSATVCPFPGVTGVTAGPSYAAVAMLPSALIEFDDGTYGWINGSFITSTGAGFTNTSINTGSTPDEWGNVFRVPFPCTVDALWACVAITAAAADFELILYSDPLGTPAVIEAISVEGNHAQTAFARLAEYVLTTPRDLDADTDYCVAVRPTTATSVTVVSFDVAAAAQMIVHPLGTNCTVGKRTDNTGAFTQTTTQRMYAGARISALGDDASAGGGGQRIISG